MTALYDSVTGLAVGVILAVLGRWGVRNAAAVVPAALPEPDRLRRQRVLVRGAITCQCLGVVFVVTGVLSAVL